MSIVSIEINLLLSNHLPAWLEFVKGCEIVCMSLMLSLSKQVKCTFYQKLKIILAHIRTMFKMVRNCAIIIRLLVELWIF